MSSIHTPIGRPRSALRAVSGPSARSVATWRTRFLAGAAALAVAGLAIGVNPATASGSYLLVSRDRLLSLPTRGGAWDYIVQVARERWPAPELDDQDSKTNVQALAAALVYARTGDGAMRAKARDAIQAMIPTYNLSEDSGLGPARQIAGWVLTADFIGLDGALDGAFRDLLRRALTRPIGSHSRWGASLRACHEDSDNNWGGWCGVSRIAAARYLGDAAELDRAERVYRGFLGDRDAWSGFRGQNSSNGALNSAIRTWSCDASPAGYVPTNGDCGDRAGAFPADASRAGSYQQFDAMYQSETTASIVLTTELLYQAGYSRAWTARDSLARIARFDYRHGAWNLGSVQYHWPWLINKRLGTSYPTVAARSGRTFGYTDWLYGSGGSDGEPNPDPTRPADPDPTPDPTPDPAPDPTPAPTHKGKGHGPKKSPGPGSVSATVDGETAADTTLSIPASNPKQATEPGRTESGKDNAKSKAKAKAASDDKRERKRIEATLTMNDVEPPSLAPQLIAGSLLAAFIATVLVHSRRRNPGS